MNMEDFARVGPGKNGVDHTHLIIWHPTTGPVWPDGTYHALCGEKLPAPEMAIHGNALGICNGCELIITTENDLHRPS